MRRWTLGKTACQSCEFLRACRQQSTISYALMQYRINACICMHTDIDIFDAGSSMFRFILTLRS